ncbi:MAG: ABC transporter ATP-binding protein [Erysipelotrichaceae bacterium]|nr:MAG: ABC transporter ATP-binding [Erysipelotrichaceae bacterium]TXT18243.1 MAG: ABC transporter ATP-binding protein [Erysipelotrichaceae bacterium]
MISLSKVTKHYHMGDVLVKALDGISFEIEEGEFVAIVGPSGSGKSTLMNILGCLDIVTDGTYKLNQKMINEYDENDLAGIRNTSIGFVFQQFNLLPSFTALENVLIPLTYARVHRKEREQTAKALLTQVGLGDRMYHKPTELSGGQQQRVSIARALANNPEIILADEPTGALDSKTGQEVLSLLSQLNQQGKTIIIITHDMAIAQHARRIIRLKDGLVESDARYEDFDV